MGRPTKSLKLPLSSPWEKWHRQKEGTVEPEIPKLEELFKKNGVRRILDLGCGTGRHTVYFAKKGYDVYSFDQSKEYINKAKRLLQQRNSTHISESGK